MVCKEVGMRYVATLVLSVVLVGAASAQCGLQNLALQKNATASSSVTPPGCDAGQAFDGDPRTAWNAGTAGTSWITVDLGQVWPVGQLWLDVAQNPWHVVERIVEVSLDGSTFRTVLRDKRLTHDFEKLIFDLPPQTTARFVRVTNVSTNSWNAYYEIGVYPPPNLPVPVATLGGSDFAGCQRPRTALTLRVSGPPGQLWLLAVQWWVPNCAAIQVPPLQGWLYLWPAWAIIGSGTLDANGQGVFAFPVSGIPTGLTYRFQAVVLDAQQLSNGGFTNLHVIRY